MKSTWTLAIAGAATAVALALLFLKPAPDTPTQNGPGAAPPEPKTLAAGENTADRLTQSGNAAIDYGGSAVETGARIELKGWVGDSSGNGLDGIAIEAQSHGFDGEEVTRLLATSNSDGEFIIENIVPERQYRLEIKPQGNHAGYILDSFSSSEAQALKEITLETIDLVDAEGLIVDTNMAPVADFELSVRSLAAQFPDRVIRSDSSGYFKLTAFPAGELSIATNASDYYRIKGLQLRPDEYRTLTLMIDRGNYHLSGWVSDDNGAPLAQVQVTLKSAFASEDYHSFSYRSTVTDDSGNFDFAMLGGHRSTLGVYAPGFSPHIREHEFESFSDSIEIRLQPGE